MFTMGILSSFILLFVCGFIEKRCERSGGFWGVQPGLEEQSVINIRFPNPEEASLEEFEEFLKKERVFVPLWWETVQKEGVVQFTPQQTKLIERFIADMKAMGCAYI